MMLLQDSALAWNIFWSPMMRMEVTVRMAPRILIALGMSSKTIICSTREITMLPAFSTRLTIWASSKILNDLV